MNSEFSQYYKDVIVKRKIRVFMKLFLLLILLCLLATRIPSDSTELQCDGKFDTVVCVVHYTKYFGKF